MVRFLESNGYDVSYTTGVDTDRRGAELLEHEVFLSVGHDEYWSGAQRANVEAARDAGVHLAFFSGNEVFWKTRWENSIDGSGTPYRTLVTYKETHANAKIDPQAADVDRHLARPAVQPARRRRAAGERADRHRSSRSTAARSTWSSGRPTARCASGATPGSPPSPPAQTARSATNVIGYEWDEDLDNGFRPPGPFRVSQTHGHRRPDLRTTARPTRTAPATHSMTLYQAPSGALVFGAGHDPVGLGPRQQARPRLGGRRRRGPAGHASTCSPTWASSPTTLQPGLVAATASTDTTAPTSTITAPASGATVPVGDPLTVTRHRGRRRRRPGRRRRGLHRQRRDLAPGHRARDVDLHLHPDRPTGSITIRSRATDDSANIEAPPARASP